LLNFDKSDITNKTSQNKRLFISSGYIVNKQQVSLSPENVNFSSRNSMKPICNAWFLIEIND